jgi:hypothetical protein
LRSSLLTILLLLGLAAGLLFLGSRLAGYHIPGNQQGYAPVQPIVFSHRLHAGELQIACLYCHSGGERSPHAGIPAATTCMNCHRFATASVAANRAELAQAQSEKRPPRRIISPELQKLYDALGLNEQLQPDPHKKPQPIPWVKVHNLPAYTRFDHRAHTNAGVECAHCHGPIDTMERVRQVSDLSMGWCVDCHREQIRTAGKPATLTDCATCHY